MKTLPVPPLTQTLDRYLETVAPLMTPDELERTRQAVADFAAGDGPRCQAALEELATSTGEQGSSWLWQPWLEAYYVSRAPLPLVSNVGFQVAMPLTRTGTAGAAELLHRCTTAHLAHTRGDAGDDLSPRGDLLCQQQWDFVEGGLREPRHGLDGFAQGRKDAADREVVVLWQGRAVAVRVGDAQGRPLSIAALTQALESVRALPPAAGVGFTAPGYLDSDSAADLIAELRTDAGNEVTYDRLRDAILCLNLTERPGSPEEHLERIAWEAEQAYPFKPVTLQYDLADGFVGLHLEHSTLDGSSLVAMIGRAQEVEPEEGSAQDAPADQEELRWTLSPALEEQLEESLARYQAEADRLRYRILTVPTPPLPELGYRLSLDACLQQVMLYAQLRAYGRVRSTYESVDMREYQGGRTECLRPNTPAAVALAQALVDGNATSEQLMAHLDAHRTQVKRCKSGQAIDRHLFGLRLMASTHDWSAPIFSDPAYARLTTDLLSTTSLGDPARIVRACFAPTSVGGIGIYYVPLDGEVEVCLNYDEEAVERIEEFAEAVREGVDKLWALVAASPQIPSP